MEKSMTFKLTRPAKMLGGDRYETSIVGERKPWVIYFPQVISRPHDVPLGSITIVIKED